jgi:translocation and assembly module TamB
MGEGTFGLAGKIGLANWRDPQWESQLRGENLSLYADETMQLEVRADLDVRGSRESGAIKGTLGLEGSAVLRSLVITPRLGVAVPDAAPAAAARKPVPFAHWTLDLAMASASPVGVGPDGADGALAPDLYLKGSVGEPVLLGTVHADKLRVVWPSGANLMAAGRIHFTSERPWTPVMDLAGVGEAGPYDIRAGIFGPLDERKLLLSSAPPLTSEQIVLLLTTGMAPVPAASGEIAPPTAEQKMSTEPSWLDLDKVRGLLGWGTATPDDAAPAEWSLGSEPVGYEWSWK